MNEIIGGRETRALAKPSAMSKEAPPPPPPPPPLKVMAAQLSRCRRRRRLASSSSGGGCCWLLEREEHGRPAVAVRMVWMQGTVLGVVEGAGGDSAMRLRDESGSFVVQGMGSIPQGRPCLVAGKYVMVMGLVLSCHPEPTLRAVKVTDLSGNPVHRSMWELEVEELHRNILP